MKKSKLEKKLAKLRVRLEYAEDNINYIYGKVTTPVMSDNEEFEDDECDCSNPEVALVELDVVTNGFACELCLNDFINNLIARVDSQAEVIESQTETIISQAKKLRELNTTTEGEVSA